MLKVKSSILCYVSMVRRVASTRRLYLSVTSKDQEHLDIEQSCNEDTGPGYDLLYPGHIPSTFFQKSLLSIGAAAVAITQPWRGDMIATLGETTGYPGLLYSKFKMESDATGRMILAERPVINSSTLSLDYLHSLPEGTFGKEYADWLVLNKAHPDERLDVHFVDDVDLAYVMRRYRQIHDLVHVILGQPTNMLGEVTVKMFEGVQTGLFMCITGGIFGTVRLGPRHLKKYQTTHFWWAVRNALRSRNLMTVYFEKHWEQPIDEFRRELNLEEPPFTPMRKSFDK